MLNNMDISAKCVIHAKPVIFFALPLLFVPLSYGISFTPSACALPPDSGWLSSNTCGAETTDPRSGDTKRTCCWKETQRGPYPKIGTTEVRYCQTCTYPAGGGSPDCKPKEVQLMTPSSRLPAGVLENPPLTLEQVPTNPTPPLSAENTNIPPSGGEEKTPTLNPTPKQQTPNIEHSPQTVSPQITQDNDEKKDQKEELPTIKNK